MTGVFRAFVGVALGVGVAVPTLTTIAIAGAAGYAVGKGVEYLFFSNTLHPIRIVVGKTNLTGANPKDLRYVGNRLGKNTPVVLMGSKQTEKRPRNFGA